MNEANKQKLLQNVRKQSGHEQICHGPRTRLSVSSDSGVSRESSFSGSDQLSTDVSRNSSFSSHSSGSSSVSRSSSWRSIDENEPCGVDYSPTRPQDISATADQRAKFRNARWSLGSRNGEVPYMVDTNSSPPNFAPIKRPSIDDHRRSSSESVIGIKSKLCSPEGLMITTPHPTFKSQDVLRSNTNSKGSDNIETRRRAVKSADNSPRSSLVPEEGAWMRNCLQILEQSIEKESKDGLLRQEIKELRKQVEELQFERDELRRERDKTTCERDALIIERDALRHEKEGLKQELENRSNIIHHMQEHLQMTSPIAGLRASSRLPPEDLMPMRRVRSKSEVRSPSAFFVPDHVTVKTAYTCL